MLRERLKRIARLLEESNAEAVDAAEQLAEEAGGTPFQAEFAPALQKIRRYDFSAALDRLVFCWRNGRFRLLEASCVIRMEGKMNPLLKKQTILLVDDAPENLEMPAAILKQDYTVKVATTGKKALDLASNPAALPDLILLDVMLPDMDGYEVCRLLKVSDLTRKIPVIFISALHEGGR